MAHEYYKVTAKHKRYPGKTLKTTVHTHDPREIQKVLPREYEIIDLRDGEDKPIDSWQKLIAPAESPDEPTAEK